MGWWPQIEGSKLRRAEFAVHVVVVRWIAQKEEVNWNARHKAQDAPSGRDRWAANWHRSSEALRGGKRTGVVWSCSRQGEGRVFGRSRLL